MKKRIKKIIYSNEKLKVLFIKYYVNRNRHKFYWILYKHPIFWIKFFLRVMGICNRQYKELKQYKNLYKNRRCFIIATGPSLTIEDLQKLKGEVTFGMNSLCKVFEKSGWETTYFIIQDHGAFLLLKDYLYKLKTSVLFHGDQWFTKEEEKGFQCKHIKFPRYYEHHGYDQTNLHTKFSYDIYKIVYEAYTVAVATLQIAAYMGFSEIYLVGADCNYNMADVDARYCMGMSYGYDSPHFITLANKMIYAYSVAKKYLDKRGVKVYNATRGGCLEVFPRVDFDSVINKINSNDI